MGRGARSNRLESEIEGNQVKRRENIPLVCNDKRPPVRISYEEFLIPTFQRRWIHEMRQRRSRRA